MITPIHVLMTDLRRLEALAEVAKLRSAGAASGGRPGRAAILLRLVADLTAYLSSLAASVVAVPADRITR
jgi:hypothetical protein